MSRRRSRARAAIASFVLALVAAILPVVAGGAPARAQLLLLGAPAIAVLVAALLGWTPGFTLAAIALGAEYALRLAPRHRLDGLAVVDAVALFAAVELGLRSLEARTRARPEPRVRNTASWSLAALLVTAAFSAFLVLAVGNRQLPAPTAGLALGLAAATTVLVAAELLRRRTAAQE